MFRKSHLDDQLTDELELAAATDAVGFPSRVKD